MLAFNTILSHPTQKLEKRKVYLIEISGTIAQT